MTEYLTCLECEYVGSINQFLVDCDLPTCPNCGSVDIESKETYINFDSEEKEG